MTDNDIESVMFRAKQHLSALWADEMAIEAYRNRPEIPAGVVMVDLVCDLWDVPGLPNPVTSEYLTRNYRTPPKGTA